MTAEGTNLTKAMLCDGFAQEMRSLDLLQNRMVRIELPPMTKPRSWSGSFYAISRRGQPRIKTVVDWSDHGRSTSVETLYTIALTLFAVTALMFAIDWLWSIPPFVIVGGFLSSIGCFIMAHAGRKSGR
jgi:hypothetical protein